MKNSLALYIGRNAIDYPHINRSLSIEELEHTLKVFFPLIYDSYKRGNGLALKIIKYLGEHGSAAIYRLSKECGASEPATINIVRRMEERGYIKHKVIKGRGPKDTYLYKLTELGVFAYSTIFHGKPITWAIDTMIFYSKKNPKIRMMPPYLFLERNIDVFKNITFREILDYLFLKYKKERMLTDFERLYVNAKRFPIPTIDALFSYAITPIIAIIIESHISLFKEVLGAKTMDDISSLHNVLITRLVDYSLLSIIEDISELDELDTIMIQTNIYSIMDVDKFISDFIKLFVINIDFTYIKAALDILLIIKQMLGVELRDEDIIRLRTLLSSLETNLNKLMNEIDKLKAK